MSITVFTRTCSEALCNISQQPGFLWLGVVNP